MSSADDQRSAGEREAMVVDAFVDLADTLISDYEPLEFLYRLVERGLPLLGAEQGGVLLHHDGGLRVVAASSEDMEALELFELQNEEGPCYDAFRSGELVTVDSLAEARDRWPRFTERALGMGLRSAHAVPLRRRDEVIGALNLFSSTHRTLNDRDARLIRGLADVGTIAILQQRAVSDAEHLSGQLQYALDSRVVIEQAKGRIAERLGVAMGDAFEVLRGYSRSNNARLTETARRVVDGDLAIDDMLGWGR